jgi:hypothetical protein
MPSWGLLITALELTPKQKRMIKNGVNPFEYSRVRQYAPLKVRKKRIGVHGKRKQRKGRTNKI